MSSLYRDYSTNKEKEQKGIEVKMSENADGSIPTFIIARAVANNHHYVKTLEQETRPFRRLIQSEKLSPAKSLEINLKVFIRALLIDWRNVQNEAGTAMPFNEENAMILFTDLPDLYDELLKVANNAAMYRDEVREIEAKN